MAWIGCLEPLLKLIFLPRDCFVGRLGKPFGMGFLPRKQCPHFDLSKVHHLTCFGGQDNIINQLLEVENSIIDWEGLTSPGADLLDLDCWMLLHTTIKIKETFDRVQGDTQPRQVVVTYQSLVGLQSTEANTYYLADDQSN